MKESLPLFDDVQEATDTGSPASQSAGAVAGQLDRVHDDLHLAAARRLARRFKRSKVQARDRVRTGRLICRHLVAMLHDIETEDGEDEDGRRNSRQH